VESEDSLQVSTVGSVEVEVVMFVVVVVVVVVVVAVAAVVVVVMIGSSIDLNPKARSNRIPFFGVYGQSCWLISLHIDERTPDDHLVFEGESIDTLCE